MKNSVALLITSLLAVEAAMAAQIDINKLPPPSTKQGLTYAKDIRPLFEASCFGCHSPSRPRPAAGLRLDTLELALQGSRDQKVIVPGDSAKSILVHAISRLDPESAMPPPPRQRRGGQGGTPRGGQNPPAAQPQGAGESGAGGITPPPGGGQRGPQGPPPKPLTPEEVGLVRAWIDQGAK